MHFSQDSNYHVESQEDPIVYSDGMKGINSGEHTKNTRCRCLRAIKLTLKKISEKQTYTKNSH